MSSFDPQEYGPVLAPLLDCVRRRSLGEGNPDSGSRAGLAGLSAKSAFAHVDGGMKDRHMAECCLAGVWLLHDLDESHRISQGIDTPSGSFWHGIMHRREGDFSNAKYWFRQVGRHPVFESLAEIEGDWDPFAFVDRCQAAMRTGNDRDRCLELQQAEWEALFDYCYCAAIDRQASNY
jgi:hypothetical protein